MRAAAAAVVAAVLALGAATASGTPAPGFADVQREVTVVAFFSTACAPCRHELPMVAALQRRLAGDAGVRVVAVSIDDGGEATAARKLATRLGVAPPVLVDLALYARLFGGNGDEVTVPRLAVVDRQLGGLERDGAPAGETTDRFVAEVTAAIAAVRARAATRPSPLWQPLPAR